MWKQNGGLCECNKNGKGHRQDDDYLHYQFSLEWLYEYIQHHVQPMGRDVHEEEEGGRRGVELCLMYVEAEWRFV